MSTDPPGLDLGRLRAHLDAHRPGLVAGDLTADVVEGGRSNLTYVVGDGRSRWVVRRPPLGHVLPTAHDMTREFRVISGLRDTAVPVPEALLLCEDADVIGAQFYVMSFVEGTPYRTADELAGTRRGTHPGHRRRAGRHARRPARRRPGHGRARRLRPARGLPGAAAAALEEAARRVPQPRPAGHRGAARPARRGGAGVREAVDHPRRLPPRQRAGRRRRPDLRGARLGDVDAGRPADRPRAAGGLRRARQGVAAVRVERQLGARATRPPTRSSPATPNARGATSRS